MRSRVGIVSHSQVDALDPGLLQAKGLSHLPALHAVPEINTTLKPSIW